MLIEVFAKRFAAVPLWREFGEPERRLLVQAFRIVKEQMLPFWTDDGKERAGAKERWTSVHNRLAMELGLNQLSARGYFRKVNLFGNEHDQWHSLAMPFVCENFVCAQYTGAVPADVFIKERLSFVELAFRDRENELEKLNSELPTKIAKAELEAKIPPPRGRIRIGNGSTGDAMRAWNRMQNESFAACVHELNERFLQAGARLNYHNGFIQISDDQRIQQQVETPFWALVSAKKWRNVDTDMKEALDRRDDGGRDPVFYAARALESTIKIISDEKGWTHGGEKGAHHYIDNLFAKKNGFLERWEHDALKAIFTELRNPLSHGPGSAEMPTLSPQQTDWAIEACMSWTKSLIKRM